MTEKQKKALKILNELWYVSHNDGLAKLRDEDYYILVECILDNKCLNESFEKLDESYDEKIRKGLIKGLSAMRDIHKHQTFSNDAININDAIAWLESLV